MQLALIGCGSRGERLAQLATSLGHVIATCADTNVAQAARAAKRLNIRVAKSPADALKAAQAVLIAEPGTAATSAALRALRGGISVFWNAPLATDPKSARSLIDAARASGAPIASAYPNRHCPQYSAAASQAQSGSIGTVGFVRVHRRAPQSAKSALDALAGDLDFIASIFGPVDTVYAQLVRRKPVNSALLTLTTGRGPIVQCACSVAPNDDDLGQASIEFCGQSGMIQFETHAPILSVRTTTSTTGRVDSSPLTPPAAERRLSAFLDSVSKGKMPAQQLRHELHIVRIVEAALDSVRTGRAVKVKR